MTSPVILYGPPAVGKDTVTDELTKLDPAYRLFPLLKAGAGKTLGYRMTDSGHLDQLRERGQLLATWRRYGNLYGVDRPGLDEALQTYRPVLHFADPDHVRTVLSSSSEQWTVVSLHCPREVAERRLRERNPADVDERLQIFDQTKPLEELAQLHIDTSTVGPTAAAGLIHQHAT